MEASIPLLARGGTALKSLTHEVEKVRYVIFLDRCINNFPRTMGKFIFIFLKGHFQGYSKTEPLQGNVLSTVRIAEGKLEELC